MNRYSSDYLSFNELKPKEDLIIEVMKIIFKLSKEDLLYLIEILKKIRLT